MAGGREDDEIKESGETKCSVGGLRGRKWNETNTQRMRDGRRKEVKRQNVRWGAYVGVVSSRAHFLHTVTSL